MFGGIHSQNFENSLLVRLINQIVQGSENIVSLISLLALYNQNHTYHIRQVVKLISLNMTKKSREPNIDMLCRLLGRIFEIV